LLVLLVVLTMVWLLLSLSLCNYRGSWLPAVGIVGVGVALVVGKRVGQQR
jgi:hypothetical protein